MIPVALCLYLPGIESFVSAQILSPFLGTVPHIADARYNFIEWPIDIVTSLVFCPLVSG